MQVKFAALIKVGRRVGAAIAISALLLAGMRGHLDLGEHPLSKTKPLTSIKAVGCVKSGTASVAPAVASSPENP